MLVLLIGFAMFGAFDGGKGHNVLLQLLQLLGLNPDFQIQRLVGFDLGRRHNILFRGCDRLERRL